MSTTRPAATGMTRGRVDVTDRPLVDVQEFAAETGSEVHIERRGNATYLVASRR